MNDFINESSVISALSKKFNCTFRKMPIKYGLDYAALRNGRVVAFIEIKCRTCRSDKYDEYMISLHKVMAAAKLSSTTNLPCFLVVAWTDAIGYTHISAPSVEFGGRQDRNDEDDIEPVALIPISHFNISPR
jgi:hypothetical protein